MLVTKSEAFVEPTAAIIYFWGPKVTQLWMGVVEPVKTACMTDPDPIRPRPTRRRHPDPHWISEKHAHRASPFIAKPACTVIITVTLVS